MQLDYILNEYDIAMKRNYNLKNKMKSNLNMGMDIRNNLSNKISNNISSTAFLRSESESKLLAEYKPIPILTMSS